MKILFQKRDYLYKFANNKAKVIFKYEFTNGCLVSIHRKQNQRCETGVVYKLSQNTTSAWDVTKTRNGEWRNEEWGMNVFFERKRKTLKS